MPPPDDSDADLSDSILFGRPTTAPTHTDCSFLDPPREDGEIGRLGSFRVVRVLGRGGMGIVFEAEDTKLNRTVALKVLRPELAVDPAARERFLMEARAVAGVDSEHVVTIYQVGMVGTTPFLAMQYLHGLTLHTRLEQPPRLDARTALQIARQTALGLAAAHARGLIHRDIKPANLWLELAPNGAFRRVKLLDFGLVRQAETATGLTATGIVLGTPNYMAPEQANGQSLDTRADLFSLGCVLYLMLSGEIAFPGDTAMQVFASLATRTPPPLRAKNPALPPAVEELVAGLLAKNPADRPASADEVAAALDDILAGPLPTGPAVLAKSPAVDTQVYVPPDSTRQSPATAARPAAKSSTGSRPTGEPITVGVLHSQTGTMAVSETAVVDATMIAIEEVNRAGGVLGRPVRPVVVDGKSDPCEFARQAEHLLAVDGAAVVFGCWTSASRKAVRRVVEQLNGLLFYPVQCEGLEQSPRIVYLGPTPNQQLFWAVDYLTGTLGKKRLLLVGSDYVYPRAAHALVRDRVAKTPGVAVVGDIYLPLGTKDVSAVVRAVAATTPDAIVNTINGSTNYFLFPALRGEGAAADRVPILSASVGEHELRALDPAVLEGDYLAASYLPAIDRDESRAFLRTIRSRYGSDRTATDAMAAAYTGVHLWAKAAAAAGSPDPDLVAAAVRGQEFAGPGGQIRVDPDTLYVWRPARIGRIQADGSVAVVSDSAESLPPVPYPATRTRQQWDRFLDGLHIGWDGHWQAPPPAKE